MRLRLTSLLLLLAACGSESPDTCTPPESFVVIRDELTGDCGPVARVLARRGRGDLPPECSFEPDQTADGCWVGGKVDCPDLKRTWWAERVDGRWLGEDHVQSPSCSSVYALELEPR